MTLQRNSKLFYMIAEAIEEFPDLHSQEEWIEAESILSENGLLERFVAGRKVDCGTSQCIAGWAWVFDGRGRELASILGERSTQESVVGTGATLLGLTMQEADILFYTMHDGEWFDWPGALRAIGDGAEDIVATLASDGPFGRYR
jgi:hypothetical protein